MSLIVVSLKNHVHPQAHIYIVMDTVYSNTSKPPAPQNMLLTLPGEIRNQIYHYLLIAPPPGVPHPLGDPPPIHPQILCVRAQINRDATALLYRQNTFIAPY